MERLEAQIFPEMRWVVISFTVPYKYNVFKFYFYKNITFGLHLVTVIIHHILFASSYIIHQSFISTKY